jgi:hypothetical protein
MLKKTTVAIQIANTRSDRVVMRCFDLAGDQLLLMGEDQDDHDVWVIRQGRLIELVGTFKPESYDKARGTGLSKSIHLEASDFEFLQPNFKEIDVDVKRTSTRGLQGCYTYTEICACGMRLFSPNDPCHCKDKDVTKAIEILQEPDQLDVLDSVTRAARATASLVMTSTDISIALMRLQEPPASGT